MKNIAVAAVCAVLLSTVFAVAHVATAPGEALSVSPIEDAGTPLKCAMYAGGGASDGDPIGPAHQAWHCEMFIASDNAQDELELAAERYSAR